MVLVAEDNAEYSASNVDKATSVCRNDFHINGHGPRNMIYPVRDLTEFELSSDSILYSPAKSAST